MEEAGMEFLLDAVDRFPLLEEFADSVEHLDPVPLGRMQANEPSYTGSPVSKDDSGCGQQIGEIEVNGRQPAARRRTNTSPTRSGQSTDRVNPEAPGWTKRYDCRGPPLLLQECICYAEFRGMVCQYLLVILNFRKMYVGFSRS
uniref:Uncharacterized protein n=1 Tax=Triticum urartu TaxID=4572 RepID=A0A8R7R5D7_TRIUA